MALEITIATWRITMSNLCRLALSFIILFSANSFSASVMTPLQKITTYNFSMDYDCANTDPNPDNCGLTSTEDHTNENLMFYMDAQWNSSIYDELTISLVGENSTTTRHFMNGFYMMSVKSPTWRKPMFQAKTNFRPRFKLVYSSD